MNCLKFKRYLYYCQKKYYSTVTNGKNFSGFNNIKIVDLTRIVAGPFCTMILGDLGAQIYKVENPVGGDECRNWPPTVGYKENEITSYFASVNRNKKSICVNLKSKNGQQIIRDMCEVCDVLVENYLPGHLDKFGLGYDNLKSIFPHLIYCSITGYGVKGCYRNRPGYDVIAASVGGLLHITGHPNETPCKPGVALTDICTGLYAHGAILAALLERSLTGCGQKINCNLLSTQISTLINIGSNYLNNGLEGNRWGSAHESIAPYESFPTTNGYITVGAGSNAQFKSLCDKMNVPELAMDDRYKTNALRVQNRISLIDSLRNLFKTKSTAEWMEIFEGASFPCGPVNSISEVFADKHVVECELVEEMSLESGQSVKVIGPAVSFGSTLNAVRSPPPNLGQHTSHVLSVLLNYSEEKIKQLRANGDIK